METASVPQHVRVRLDLETGSLASSANEFLEVADGHRRAALGHEQERRQAPRPPGAVCVACARARKNQRSFGFSRRLRQCRNGFICLVPVESAIHAYRVGAFRCE